MNYLNEAIKEANIGLENNLGGPFGAVIVKDNTIIGRGCNKVLKDHDPTAHAEISAIRDACNYLGTHDLTDCVIYTTSEPCPMCLSAIMWANIKTIYFGTDRKEVEAIGFKDNFIYNYLKNPDDSLKIIHIENEECKTLLKQYNNIIY